MDLSEKDKFGSKKSNGDPINYPDWRFGGDFRNPSLNLVETENPMSVCKGGSMDSASAPCSSVSMVDSFCPTLWDHHGSLSFSENHIQTSTSSSDAMGIGRGVSGSGSSSSRLDVEKGFDVDWSNPNPNSISKGGVFVHQSGIGILPQSLSQFPADSGFIERAARFSCFNGGNFSDMVNPFGISGSMVACSKSGGIQVPEILSNSNAKLLSRPQSQKSLSNMAEAGKDEIPVDHRFGEGSSMKNTEREIGGLLRGSHEGKTRTGQVSNESDEAEFSGSGQEEPSSLENALGESASKAQNAKKRRRNTKDTELEEVKRTSQSSMETAKEIAEYKKKIEQNPTSNSTKNTGKHAKENSQNSDASKEEYIHIRARRGQATNSHSLAERVRREKISERMKLLQGLVPGCSKVTGKAVMLDEIINYVQSLQRQVEFLSMKLATVNPRLDFSIDGLLSKDFLQPRAGTSTVGFAPDMSMAHPQLHPTQQGLVQAGLPGIGNPADTLRRSLNSQLTSMNGYREPTSQMPNVWDDELHNVFQMNFGTNIPFNSQELNGSLPPGHMKVEL